jgi:IMP dehydrogenase/GMP reductase
MLFTSLGFDDVTILPAPISKVTSRLDTNISVSFGKYTMPSPLMCAPMDTVINELAYRYMALNGVTPCLHRFHKCFADQHNEITTVKLNKINDIPVIASIPANELKLSDTENIVIASDIVLVDTAMGANIKTLKTVEIIKNKYPSKFVIAGNVVTHGECMSLIDAGADAIRVGIGSGAGCITRTQTGIGRGQISAILDCHEACHKNGVKLISDGGIRKPADVCKALCVGADMVMIGSLFAGYEFSPGDTIEDEKTSERYKMFRGMASEEAQCDNSSGLKKGTTAEGIAFKMKLKTDFKKDVQNLLGGLRSCMTYLNAKEISDLKHSQIETLSAGCMSETYNKGGVK